MKTFQDFINQISDINHQERIKEILTWISTNYPQLEERIAWNSPHFVSDGTFIIAINHAKAHVSFVPEHVTILKFRDKIEKNAYQATDFLFKIKWNQMVDYALLKEIIEFNIQDKKGLKTYWR
jgi:uncharacterized protein